MKTPLQEFDAVLREIGETDGHRTIADQAAAWTGLSQDDLADLLAGIHRVTSPLLPLIFAGIGEFVLFSFLAGAYFAGKSERKKRASVFVEGGVVNEIEVPQGVEVVVYDYDIEDVAQDQISKGPQGEPCLVGIWEAKP